MIDHDEIRARVTEARKLLESCERSLEGEPTVGVLNGCYATWSRATHKLAQASVLVLIERKSAAGDDGFMSFI